MDNIYPENEENPKVDINLFAIQLSLQVSRIIFTDKQGATGRKVSVKSLFDEHCQR